MTRKDYECIASAIRATRFILRDRPVDNDSRFIKGRYAGNGAETAIITVENALIDALCEDNPRFNADRFREACET